MNTNNVTDIHSTDGRIQALLNLGFELRIRRTDNGDYVKSSLFNIVQLLRNHPILKGRAKRDGFSGLIFWENDEGKEERFSDRQHIPQIRFLCEDRWGVAFKKEDVLSAINLVSCENEINPLRDHIESLRGLWDPKKDKPEAHLLLHYLGAADSKKKGEPGYMARVYSYRWLLSIIARSYASLENLVKADPCLLLYGKQRIGKSTALQIICFYDALGRRYFGDTELDMSKYPDAVMQIRGKLIYELQEMAGRPKDAKIEKRFLSLQRDDCRFVYARTNELVARKTIFAYTSNKKNVLTDATGNSRLWCVDLGNKKINMKRLRERMPYIWSEIIYRYDEFMKDPTNTKKAKLGQWWLTNEEEIEHIGESSAFEQTHPMTESIERIITDMRESDVIPLKVPDILQRLKEELCPFLEPGVRANSRIISDVLQRSGYDYDRRRIAYSSDERIRGWWPALK
jgi:predicted P-loop ATPase